MTTNTVKLYLRNLQSGCLAWVPTAERHVWLSQHFRSAQITLPKSQLARMTQSAQITLTAPTRVCWSVSSECNLKCDYCIGAKQLPELDTEQKKHVLRNLLESGILTVDFSGGEPLLGKDLFQLMEMVREHGRGVTITTNGTLLHNYLSRIAPLVDCVRLSIDGATPESHDRSRKCPGLFSRIMQNIELLHRHAVQFRVNTVVMKPNFHEVGRVTGLAKSMGASGIALLQYLPVGQAADKLDYAISTVDFLQLGRKLKEEHEDETFRVFLKDTKSVEGYLVVQADGRAYVNRSTETGESRIRQVLIGDLVTDQLSEVWCRAFQAPTTLSL